MTRTSNDEYQDGRLINGYDYDNQAWALDGKYVRCGHPEDMDCGCYGKEHEGEKTQKKEKEQFKKMIGEVYEMDSQERQEAINAIPPEKGAVVMVYEDPRTRKIPEGQAILIRQLEKARRKGDLERWKVKFEDGDIVERFVSCSP